ncbi:hypothetical protein BKA70DRAFT_1579024 [Coprinopsis sp. MPI-PUGE-AT-0042]|nr:hypothetical protein BKA70DRAFT_1579024 [Coprinopsis sp. MPI-PUGE-AT-0042]
MAIKTETGWAFQNVATKRFLGLPISVLPIPDGIRLSAVSHECIWVVLPHHEDTAKFKLWIQFTARVMNLRNGETGDDTPIYMDTNDCEPCQWWRFEPVDDAWERARFWPESEPGEPEVQR